MESVPLAGQRTGTPRSYGAATQAGAGNVVCSTPAVAAGYNGCGGKRSM